MYCHIQEKKIQRGLVYFYRRVRNNGFSKMIYQEMHKIDEIEVLSQAPLAFKLKDDNGIGTASLYEGEEEYSRAERRLRSFGLY